MVTSHGEQTDERAASRAGLSGILAALDTTLLDVVCGEPEHASEIGGVVIYDELDKPDIPHNAVVLGVGVHGSERIASLVEDLAAQGAAVLVVRAPVEADDTVRNAVARTGMVLLELTRGAAWTRLAALLRSLLVEGDLDSVSLDVGMAPVGDLFSLADKIADLLDAPITIEDCSSRVVAFSGRQEEADQSRIDTIIGRRVPDRYARVHNSHGVFHKLYRTKRPIFIEPAAPEDPAMELPRVAIAVWAGDEILGSIWAAVREPLPQAREHALVEAAKLVALHLLRMRAAADVERQLRTDLVAALLEGRPSAVSNVARLRLDRHGATVLAMTLADEQSPPESEGDPPLHATIDAQISSAAARQQATEALALHTSTVWPGSVVAMLGETTYAVLPTSQWKTADEQAARIADDFLRRAGGRVAALFGIGRSVQSTSELSQSRKDADRALRAVREGRTNRRVVRFVDVYFEVLLMELGDMVRAEKQPPAGPVSRLAQYDAKHGSDLVATLRVWLDSFGDSSSAAGAVHVHPNTLRYRLRRIADISGINLGDPQSRLTAMLELSLLDVPDS